MLSHVSAGAFRACSSSLSASKRSTVNSPSSLLCAAIQQRHLGSSRKPNTPAHAREAYPRPKGRSSSAEASTGAGAGKDVQLPRDIAVLGGGLTGLTTAHYLTRFLPDAKITIYEAADRLGGWLDTERIDVKTQDGKDATVTFERGARTIAPQNSMGRWEDFIFFDLLNELALADNPEATLYAIPKHHPVLSKRYIYYPDHLVEAPGPLPPDTPLPSKLLLWIQLTMRLMTEPVFKGLIPTVSAFMRGEIDSSRKFLADEAEKGEDFIYSTTFAMKDHTDVSVGEFLCSREIHPDLVNNMASAIFHGVWGGDIWKLSALETTLQSFFLQAKHYGRRLQPVKDHDYHSGRDIVARSPAVVDIMLRYGRNFSYVGFHNGFGELSDALASNLKANPNVTVKTGHPVSAIRFEGEEKKAVVESSNETHRYDRVISTLYSGTLANLTGDSLPTLKESAAVTIQIVNLWYPNPHLTAQYPGFGYLIPQSVPAEKNPHAALGVIFDSDREAAAGSPEYTAAPGTKLTVMLGGHYWDYLDPDSWPSAEEATAMAIETVQLQLGIPSTEPVYTSTKTCRDCIPQHLVGHRERMAQAHSELHDAFQGTLTVVGGSYTSPGVLPTLKAARDMALTTSGQAYLSSNGENLDMDHVGQTGLGRFVGRNEKYLFLPGAALPFRNEMIKTKFA